jgi:hypothetical protein
MKIRRRLTRQIRSIFGKKTIMLNTLVVITQQGNVYGSVIAGHTLGPVFEFSGAKIGFNPQDKFMVALIQNVIP